MSAECPGVPLLQPDDPQEMMYRSDLGDVMMRTRLKAAVMVPALSVVLSSCCLTSGGDIVFCDSPQSRDQVSGRNQYRNSEPYLPSIDIPRYDWDG